MNCIEKNIHQIWIQGEEHLKGYSPINYAYTRMWKQKAEESGYTYKLWSENDYLPLAEKYDMLQQYTSRENITQKSDIARFLILYEYGGLYVDVDIEPIFPDGIPEFCADVVLLRFPIGIFSFLTLQNAFIGMKRSSAFGRLIIEEMRRRCKTPANGTWEYISSTTGSKLIKSVADTRIKDNFQYLDDPQISFDYGNGYYLSTKSPEYFIVHQLSGKSECNSICQLVRLYSMLPPISIILIIIHLLGWKNLGCHRIQ